MTTETVGPLEEMLEHVREALKIFCQHSHLLKDKTTRDYLHRANYRLSKIDFSKLEASEPVKNDHIEETAFCFVASSMREGKVDGQRVALEEVF